MRPGHVTGVAGAAAAGRARLGHPARARRLRAFPPLGFDVSHPQCGSALPAGGGYGIVGIARGKALTANPCLKTQLAWANSKPGHAVYLNTGYPGTGDPVAYGRAAVDHAIRVEHAVGHGTSVWWLDVETINTWAGTQQENATVLDAMAARLLDLGVQRRDLLHAVDVGRDRRLVGSWSTDLVRDRAGHADRRDQRLHERVRRLEERHRPVDPTGRTPSPDHGPQRDLPSVAGPCRGAARRRLRSLAPSVEACKVYL